MGWDGGCLVLVAFNRKEAEEGILFWRVITSSWRVYRFHQKIERTVGTILVERFHNLLPDMS